MSRYVFAVQSNPVEGLEAEYHEWYSGRHTQDLLSCPGVNSVRRLSLAECQIRNGPHPFQFLALYEIETENLQAFIDELNARAGTERMSRSDALADDVWPVFWKVL